MARSASGSRRHTQRDQEPLYEVTGEDEAVCAYDTGEAHSWGCEGGDQGEVWEFGKTLECRSRVHVGFYCLSLPFDML
jgi:hypothetical protein